MIYSSALPFLPGEFSKHRRPLARYHPHIPGGVITTWLEETEIPTDCWLLDPFGTAPDLAIETVQSGRNILVAVNNPITRFILELTAQPPGASDLKAALATLASARLRNERIEPHIRALYSSDCQQCQQTITVDAFLWKQGDDFPYGRIYSCPHCNDTGERETTPKDRAQAKKFGDGGFHRVRALERVAPLHDPDRVYVEEALNTYPGRAIYILSTLINKLDGLPLSTVQQRSLRALLLIAFEQANALWPHPQSNQRPQQLSIPHKYYEHNIWLALENATALWATDATPVPISYWPQMPTSQGGICIFNGRFKELSDDLDNQNIAGVISALPRPNQAYWAFCALWSGWLWGAEAVEDFKPVLRRQSYDWRWHTGALLNILEPLAGRLAPQTPVLGLIAENNSDFLCASMAAANLAGLQLQGLALRTVEEQIQLRWNTQKPVQKYQNAPIDQKPIQEGAKSYLRTRAEPANYLPLLGAGLATYIQTDPFIDCSTPDEAFSKLKKRIGDAFSYRGGFLRLAASAQKHESGYWWLEDFDESVIPLADRVEMSLVQMLIKNPNSRIQDLDAAICASFPGLLTPSLALIQVCLESYGQQNPDTGLWKIRPGDEPAARRADLTTMGTLIEKLGHDLSFETEEIEDRCYQWVDLNNQPSYTIFLTASALLGRILTSQHGTGIKRLIIMPGGRANLVSYKLEHNPFLQQQVEDGWQLIKYRHVRHLTETSTLAPVSLDSQLALDPFEKIDPQLRLL